jgi:hypothetical protein
MPSEHEPAGDRRRLPARGRPGASAQQREQHGGAEQRIDQRVFPTMDVTAGNNYVHPERDDEQAGDDDVGRLEVAVARPKARPPWRD